VIYSPGGIDVSVEVRSLSAKGIEKEEYLLLRAVHKSLSTTENVNSQVHVQFSFLLIKEMVQNPLCWVWLGRYCHQTGRVVLSHVSVPAKVHKAIRFANTNPNYYDIVVRISDLVGSIYFDDTSSARFAYSNIVGIFCDTSSSS
jgi:hypothetical protein